MEKLGKEQDSKFYWDQATQDYVDALAMPYHEHRLKVAFDLIPVDLIKEDKIIYDFGCGDAIMFEPFIKSGAKISGCDIVPDMIAKAKVRLAGIGGDSNSLSLGGVNCLKNVESNSLDALISFNVLAYLSQAEELDFYSEAKRIVKKDGKLIVSHSNKLFDLFSLNRYTVEFFREEFVSNVDDLLCRANQPVDFTTYNIRENPLCYKFKLANFGFEEIGQRFSNLHEKLPGLQTQKNYPDTLNFAEDSIWKLMFKCSTYMSLSRKT